MTPTRHETVTQLMGWSLDTYGRNRMTHDLRRLHLHGLIERIPHTRRYRVTDSGLKTALCYHRTSACVLRPAMLVVCDAPRIGANFKTINDLGINMRFNPRPRMGATAVERFKGRFAEVSIRAPAWGRPIEIAQDITGFLVSIRAPAWGRQPARHPVAGGALVSIRAPAWGRRADIGDVLSPLGFQSAPPHGGDPGWLPHSVTLLMFQSAPPHGGDVAQLAHDAVLIVSIRAPAWGRLMWKSIGAAVGGFNPRPRMGATYRREVQQTRLQVSIRAPAWGRRGQARVIDPVLTFQSAPPHGGDGRRTRWDRCWRRFNPRPRMGATRSALRCWS